MNESIKPIKDILHTQFKHILIPVSSEFYHREVYTIATELAEKFDSTITLLYIIEEKTLVKTDKISDTYRTHYDIEETKREIIRESTNKAAKLIFSEAEQLFSSKNISLSEKIIRGEFSPVIKQELEQNSYDLVLMGFEKGCLLNYRLFKEVTTPIWIEAGNPGNTILAVCSNLAPNQKVPIMGMYLSQILGWPLQMLYIIDMEDSVMVDISGKRSGPKSESELTIQGNLFIQEMKNIFGK